MRVGEFWILACLGMLLLLAVLTDRLRQRVLRAKGLI
jgi:predicted ABC-type sugar transport system permease subunit